MKVDLAYAERQLRYFSRLVDKLRLTSDASDAKEDEKGKETFPPAPPIEKRQKLKKRAAATAARVRAREEFVPPSREEAVKFAESKDIPNLFVDYWLDCMNSNYTEPWFDCATQSYIADWVRSLLCYWSNADKDKAWFAYRREHEKATPREASPRTVDWTLCAERCANCDGKGCKRGIKVPPACDPERPRPPEECPRFAVLGA